MGYGYSESLKGLSIFQGKSSMGKKVAFLICATVAVAWLASGCNMDKNHNRKHWKSVKYDMGQLHKEIDFYFLDYDEEDPWRN